ncbi:MAG: hypothetical protein A2660_01075 [Candidatus Doudnabacteria bacterium RIFCSPHIGHO2_01_FULL_45_18]|uniref:Uncharacterized protein n=1 Tax=Candidatus Doudnabacteria bacterium RIFCSPHIGHO2_01_FULL_45_18 TaxID=1817823 RepID=A0A1F5NRI9_9BACT|nr:MAG: hypothetical protein A2660_01075 [Candidatus Doudnabacteria bacterium RIFCSPHIGHO2_01_FULL_45_18]
MLTIPNYTINYINSKTLPDRQAGAFDSGKHEVYYITDQEDLMVNITPVVEGRKPGEGRYSFRTPDGTKHFLGSMENGLIADPRFNVTLGLMNALLHPNMRPWHEIPGTNASQQGIQVPNDVLESLIESAEQLRLRQAS